MNALEMLWRAGFFRSLREESGQAMTEYASITSILTLMLLAGVFGWQGGPSLFGAMQDYVNFFFYCLDVASN